MAGSHSISRRDFIKLATAAVGTFISAAVGLPAIAYLIDPALKVGTADAWIPLGKLDGFEAGKPTLVNFTRSQTSGWEKTVNSYGVFVLRKSDTEALALSNICTHLGCRVNWKDAQQAYVCPCHDATFDLQGKVLGGPPPSPLNGYETKVENGTLFIHFLEG